MVKLYQLGIRVATLNWNCSVISDSLFKSKQVLHYRIPFSLENEIPQRSVISPLLFAVMINDLSCEIKPKHGLFADDCAFWESDLSIPYLIDTAQSTLNKICNWCIRWGFAICKTKSVDMLFTRKRELPPLALLVDGSPISFVEKLNMWELYSIVD